MTEDRSAEHLATVVLELSRIVQDHHAAILALARFLSERSAADKARFAALYAEQCERQQLPNAARAVDAALLARLAAVGGPLE